MQKKVFSKQNVDIQIQIRPKQSALENMQTDGALLELSDGAFLHFHQWNKPSFTYGYFVKPDEEFLLSEKIDVARRVTGGGILYHGKDLSFALCFPDTHRLAHADTLVVYENLNRIMMRAILDVHPCLIQKEQSKEFSFKEPFCMSRATQYDLIVDQKKVLGCAIRRKNQRLLYHCSIPLKNFVSLDLLPYLKRGQPIVEKILQNTYAIGSDWNLLRERIEAHVTENG